MGVVPGSITRRKQGAWWEVYGTVDGRRVGARIPDSSMQTDNTMPVMVEALERIAQYEKDQRESQ